ncbi:uncharacterized protein TNCV_2867921 [Trichonephila clavipes]|nr:uncharacterized protein TNCV_2867921 [Trichonephila clavipes]
MLFRFVGKLDRSKFYIRCQRIRFFISVFIIYQIIDNLTVIETYVFIQVRAASALRESNGTCVVERLFITNEPSVAFLGFWTVRTVLNPISGQVIDEGYGESGVLHSARWHGGDWMVGGIREAWLLCFVWMVNLEKFLTWLRA